MSRCIVKNLPKDVTEDELKTLFQKYGSITDCVLKYKNGVFRQFAFVGFDKPTSAALAIGELHRSFMRENRLIVEKANDTELNSAPVKYQPKPPTETPTQYTDQLKAKLSEVEKDSRFEDYLSAHGLKKDLLYNEVSSTQKLVPEKVKIETNKIVISDSKKEDVIEKPKTKSSKITSQFVVQVKNLPGGISQADIERAFQSLNLIKIHLPNSKKSTGRPCYIELKTQKDLDSALRRNKSFIKGKKIIVLKANSSSLQNEKKGPELNENSFKKKWVEKTEEETAINQALVLETGRLFLRNLPFKANPDDLREHFSKFGTIKDVHVPMDPSVNLNKGIAFVQFEDESAALQAMLKLDGSDFMGRLLHVMAAESAPEVKNPLEYILSQEEMDKFKAKKAIEKTEGAGSARDIVSWNSLFIGPDAVASLAAERLGISKQDFLSDENASSGQASVGVRMALAETQLVDETRTFLEEHGVALDALSNSVTTTRSSTIFLVKNLTSSPDLEKDLYAKLTGDGDDARKKSILRFVLPPHGLAALVQFADETSAKVTFKKLAYSKFNGRPLYLEWAPIGVLPPGESANEDPDVTENDVKVEKAIDHVKQPKEENEDAVIAPPSTMVFVRNICTEASENELAHFVNAKLGWSQTSSPISSVTIVKKKFAKSKNLPDKSLGFGFIHFHDVDHCSQCLRDLQGATFQGQTLHVQPASSKQGASEKKVMANKVQSIAAKIVASNPLKRPGAKDSERADDGDDGDEPSTASTTLLIRNVPFEATEKDLRELFDFAGLLRSVRLPRKLSGLDKSTDTRTAVGASGSIVQAYPHRGFGFVEFSSHNDAKTAFRSMQHSTHLYGRRLVIEWAAPKTTSTVLEEPHTTPANAYAQPAIPTQIQTTQPPAKKRREFTPPLEEVKVEPTYEALPQEEFIETRKPFKKSPHTKKMSPFQPKPRAQPKRKTFDD